MIVSFRCPCGQVNRVVGLSADGLADCPACRRTVVVAGLSQPRGLWIALAVVGFFVAVSFGSIIAYVVMSNAKSSTNGPIARATNDELKPIANVTVPTAPATRATQPTIPEPPEIIAPMPEPPAVPLTREGVLKPTLIEPSGRYKLGETFVQEVVVTRRSTFRMLGNDFSQGAQYSLSSRITISKVNEDGSVIAEQTILATRPLDADPDLKVELAAALEKAKGMKFELTVGKTGEVTAIKGIKDPIQVKAGRDDIGQSLRLWSILDADGWKELAGLMFFQPEKPLKKGESWSKPVVHDWGALGSWHGKTKYLAQGIVASKPPANRIDFVHDIYYKPAVAGADRNLPIRIGKAEFHTIVAGGAILFDSALKRSTTAEETFRVRGQLQVSLAGVDTVVEMEEHQHFKLTFNEPGQRNLVGRPLPDR